MSHRPMTSPITKYAILKPNQKINLLKRSFAKPFSSSQYEIAIKESIRIRRSRQEIKNLEATLQECQWRSQEKSSIVKCHYVQILPLSFESKSLAVEIYTDDLEIAVSQMKKLLLSEAIYLIRRAIKGFHVIWDRYRQVSVNQQTIGLDCNGNCLVWLNRSLGKHSAEDCNIKEPSKIMREIIFLIKSKCEPTGYSLLAKLLDNIEKKYNYPYQRSTFQNGLNDLNEFSKIHRIKQPQNLKYLVNQQRLEKKATQIRTLRETMENEHAKAPRFMTSRLKFAENATSAKYLVNNISKPDIFSTLRKTTSPYSNVLTCRPKNHERLQYTETDNKPQPIFLFRKEKNKSVSNHSRFQTEYSGSVKPVSNNRPKTKKEIQLNSHKSNPSEKSSGFSGRVKTAESLTEVGSIHKISHLSNVKVPKKIVECLNPKQQLQSIECSPFLTRDEEQKQKRWQKFERDQSQDNSFKLILQADIIRANKWTKTVQNILDTQIKLNQSITMGKDVKSYLSDVKLEKMNLLNTKRQKRPNFTLKFIH